MGLGLGTRLTSVGHQGMEWVDHHHHHHHHRGAVHCGIHSYSPTQHDYVSYLMKLWVLSLAAVGLLPSRAQGKKQIQFHSQSIYNSDAEDQEEFA